MCVHLKKRCVGFPEGETMGYFTGGNRDKKGGSELGEFSEKESPYCRRLTDARKFRVLKKARKEKR